MLEICTMCPLPWSRSRGRTAKRMHQAQADGQLAADADLDVAVDLVYGPLYHRLVFHLGMPNAEQLHTLVAHAVRAFAPVPQS